MGQVNVKSGFWVIGIVTIELVLACLATLTVMMRIWARRIKRATLKLNDYMIFIALVANFAKVGIYMRSDTN